MDKIKNNIKNVLPCIVYGGICGTLTGAVIFFFKYAASRAEALSRLLYSSAKRSPIYIILTFAALITLALFMILIHKKAPESKGGGIPRSEGVLRGLLPIKWLRTFIGTVIGSMISFFAGLPLGSEGPAVLIGTSVGSMCVSGSKNKSAWSRYVMTSGAGAGFAVATGAPLSGVLFALEEIHKRFTPLLVLSVSVSVVCATYVNRLLCQLFGIGHTLFNITALGRFELDSIPFLLLLGILVSAAVAIYDASIAAIIRFTAKHKKHLPTAAKIIAVFVITGVFGFIFTEGIYNGHHLIDDILHDNMNALLLIGILSVRFLLMLLCTDSGVTGGMFIPALAIGALVSAIISKLMPLLGLSSELTNAVILLGMCAFIGGTLRAPLTAVVLFVELTGQLTDIFFITIVIFTVNAITELIHLTPFYDSALEKMVENQYKGREAVIAHFTAKISSDAFVIGKAVRDVMWPNSTVVVSIKREDENSGDSSNDGEKKLYAGDTLILRSQFYDENELIALLHGLLGKDSDIHKMA
ncbi:MAG: ClC family H(+)/Cl(-) exchange transporter [Clostridia bacterium]|nr:ClC family H(+)/Cl(-) exchange transporter [Clostridia bacterium]